MALKFFQNLIQRFTGKPVDWDELEETLIRADFGIASTTSIIDTLRERQTTITAQDAIEAVKAEILSVLPPSPPPFRPLPNRPKVILVTGVNGTGKTTSCAKLAHFLKRNRHSVLLAAADTFRAAAVEQLQSWSERIDVPIFTAPSGADPAAVCHDAWSVANRQNIEFLICDTAGRLHTRANLMAELQKIRRTLQKQDPTAPHETLLVVDATTGSNALTQAREFHQATPLTGVVITKLDGSGKGGIAIAIQKELNIPPRCIGTGEKPEDFSLFDRDEFLAKIL